MPSLLANIQHRVAFYNDDLFKKYLRVAYNSGCCFVMADSGFLGSRPNTVWHCPIVTFEGLIVDRALQGAKLLKHINIKHFQKKQNWIFVISRRCM